MIPLQNRFVGAFAAIFSSRKFSRRSLTARQRLAALRAVTVRQRFGIASRAATLAAAGVLAFAGTSRAAVFTKNATAGDLSLGTSWASGTVPGGSDIALFNNTVTAAQVDTITSANVTFGELQIVNPGGLITINGPDTLTLNGVNGVGIDMSAATQNLTIGAPLILGGSQAWNVATGRLLTINGTTGFSQGTNTLTLNGAGTVEFILPAGGAASTTATGGVTVNNGTLEVYANTPTVTYSSPSNSISGSTPLTMAGGAITIAEGNSVGAFTQNFSSLTIAAGASTSGMARGSSSSVLLNFHTVARNVGGTFNFAAAATNNSGYVFGNGTNGIVGGFATYNGTDFIRFVSATTTDTSAAFAPTYTNDTWAAANNTTVTLASNTQTSATTNSLRFAAVAADTVTLSGTNIISSGGILISSAVTAGNADVITGGTLEGGAGADLIVNQFGAGTLAINSVIADNTSATALTKTGTGTLLLGGANTFTGGIFINQGTIQLTSGGSLNANPITFDNNSSGIVTLAGNSTSVGALNTSTVLATTLPQIQNASATAATLTINATTNGTYAGNLLDGTGGGSLGLTLTGTGTQTLTGTNSYTGPTAINGGTLVVAKTIASSTAISVGSAGTLNVSALTGGLALGSSNTLSGFGSVVGNVTVGAGANLTPGAAGTVGTLTLGGLTLSSGTSTLNFILNTGSNDLVAVTGTNGLTINGGQFNLSGTATATVGTTFDLLSYTGTIQGTGVNSLTVASGGTPGLIYTFGNDTTNHFVTLTITGGGALANYYVPDANGAYSTGTNWSAGASPNAVGAFASFGGSGSTALTANRTVTVDGANTVGLLAFNSTTGFGYTLANGGTGTGLTLNNGSSPSSVTDTAGTHTIAAPLTMTPNGASFSVSAATDTLTVSGVVSSDANTDIGLSKSGNGTLALTGVNTYFGGTALNSGTIQINADSGLGDTSGALTFGGGTLQLLANVTSARNYQVSGGNNAVIDTNGNSLALSGTITPVSAGTGGVVKNGVGLLTLSGANTYTGGTTVNAGTVSVAADAALGAAPTSATTNLTINGGTLQATATLTLNANRNITLGSTNSTIDVENGAVVTYAGVMSGSGNLNLTGVGTLALSTVQTFSGNTTITGANLQFGVGAGLPGTVTLNNGATFTLQSTGSTSVFPGNTFIVGSGATATLSSNNFASAPGSLITSVDATSVLDINGAFSLGATNVKQFSTGYTGTVHLNAGSGLRFSGTINGVGDGGDTTTFDLGAGSDIFTKNGGNISLGALTGTGGLFGASGGGVINYTIGNKNISTTFPGTINNNSMITVAGTGTLTLTGANTYTGTTTINAGSTLQIDNGGTTGTLGTGAVANNGTFAYDRSDATTVANTFSGSGTLVTLGGTTTFTAEVDEGTINPRFGTAIFDPAAAGLQANALNSTIGPIAGDNATVTVQNNGSYNVNSANLIVGGLGTGTLNVNGPTAAGNGTTGGMVSLVAGLTIGNGATAVGTVNLNAGGTLTTPLINTAGGTSTLNLNGGTLVVAGGATGTFMTGLTAANVLAGGAIINDGGNTITIAQALTTSPALAGAADGGLTKLGTGMLTLSAANTFNGGTTVSAGTLIIAANGGLGTGNVTIASGATLSLSTGVSFAHNGPIGTTLTLADATSVLNLAAMTAGTVQDVVGTLVVAGTTYTTMGYYGSSTSGVATAFQLPEFTGNGVIGVGEPAAIPEPTGWTLLLAGLGGLSLLGVRCRRGA